MVSRPLRPFRRPRKRGATRLFSVAALVVTAALTASPASAQSPSAAAAQSPLPLVRFDIPAGPLDAALRAFESTTGLSVVVQLPSDTVGMMQSPGVSGTLWVADAPAALLEGTALAGTPQANGSIVVDVQGVRESLEVTGQLPRVSSPKYVTPISSTPQTIQVIPRSPMP